MSSLSVVFAVPEQLEQGLATGNLQRVGGVIVDGASKQVVAWLRDSPGMTSVIDATGNFPTPLSAIMNTARTSAALWNGNMAQTAIDNVSHQIHHLKVLSSFTLTGQALNLALSAATFFAMMERLDRLTQEVRAEFATDRDIRFKTALEAARDAFESDSPRQREKASDRAKYDLFQAREHFLSEFRNILKDEINEDKLLIAQHCLIRALYAEISRIRCYIVVNELKSAKQKLQESIPLFRDASQTVVRYWLGKHPSIFFHQEVLPEDLDRFLMVQRWLRHDDLFSTADDAPILFEILNEMRGDFWNQAVIEDEYNDIFQQVIRRPTRTFKDRVARLITNLGQAEIAVENYQRLVGFDFELRSLRLSFEEWDHYIPEEDLRQHGIGIIVDEEMLDNAHKRLML